MSLENGIDFSAFNYAETEQTPRLEIPKVKIYDLRDRSQGADFLNAMHKHVTTQRVDYHNKSIWNGSRPEAMLRRALEIGLVQNKYDIQLEDFGKSFVPEDKVKGFAEKYSRWDMSCIAEFDWIQGEGRYVRLLPEALHFKLLQSRAEYVFSNSALRRLRDTNIAIAGMGVGSTLSEVFVRLGLKHLRIADRSLVKPHDLKSVSGTTVHSYGANHAIDAARYLYLINPYLDLQCEPKYLGLTDTDQTVSLETFLGNADIGFEEIDNLGIKGPFRDVIKSHGRVAITVTDTGAGGILSAEYPTDPNFFGRVDARVQAMLEDPNVDLGIKTQYAVEHIIGMENIPPHYLQALGRAKEARAKFWPQPTMSAYLTAAKAATAVMLHLEGVPINKEVSTDLWRRLT